MCVRCDAKMRKVSGTPNNSYYRNVVSGVEVKGHTFRKKCGNENYVFRMG